ncbi:MAG: glycoside hydrolase family 16 protein [Oscillospiraceae bacterium]|nr:glycoside hydrolase family 16 protein [Oscillospiraceae bacterium]
MISELMALMAAVNTELSTFLNRDALSYKIFDHKPYYMTFEDNFEGTELDLSKWERCPEQRRQDLNNYWKDDMSYLDGEGHLVLEMSYDEETDRFNSGAVRTRGIFEQAYGYFEIRCTLNNVPGYWTAFWLMGDSVNSEKNGGKDGTEIDIYESPFYNEKKIQHTLNWDGYGSAHKSEGKVVNADVYDGEFHTFGFLWTEDEYVYYIDGRETWRTDAQKAKGTCEVPLFLKFSAETGGWTGLPDKDMLPDRIYADYVRVYSAR